LRHVHALLLVPALVVALTGCQETSEKASASLQAGKGSPSAAPEASETYTLPSGSAAPQAFVAATKPTPRATTSPRPVVAALLYATSGGDGDSWKDTQGREYRMGLIDTPEAGQCYGDKATSKRKQLVANGFRAKSYTTDSYGRLVSVISLPDGTNLNVWMARNGYATDKYLATFRDENPSLATKLDSAFAAAKSAKLGLWSACKSGSSTTGGSTGGSTTGSSSGSCHPSYVTCIPIKGDGSGNGEENDLDCPDIGKRVQLRSGGGDPYRLDNDGDGYGCDSY
jgi:endonuclease YncB( thermonuclease family)